MKLAELAAFDNGDGTVRLTGDALIDQSWQKVEVDIPKTMIDLLLVNAKRMGVVA